MTAYQGKGKFYNDLDLSNKGLRGSGKLDYLTSRATSDTFMFYPDSMNTAARQYLIGQSDPLFPTVKSIDVKIHWLPKVDKMYSRNRDKKQPFEMFNNETHLDGVLLLTPTGLIGSGNMDLTSATMNSDTFKYGTNTIDAKVMTFNLLTKKKDAIGLTSMNVSSHIDFARRNGTFKMNNDTSKVQFPQNNYYAYVEGYTWEMDNNEMKLFSHHVHHNERSLPDTLRKSNQIIGSFFVSYDKKQDSLYFISPQANYDYDKNTITAEKVDFINVADAMIIPYKGKVVIEEKAHIRILEHAKVITDTTLQYHYMYSASVNIESRNMYKGNADYNYIDEVNNKQKIHFSEINVDTSKHTSARGFITETDSFMLSPDFQYQGDVHLASLTKSLFFDGSAKIQQRCNNMSNTWFNFKALIDPMEVMIPIPQQIKDVNRRNIYTGTMLNTDSVHVYSSFFGYRKNYMDTYVVTANGYLYFDKKQATYKIASLEKLKDPFQPGNSLSLNRDSCIQSGEGKINLSVDLGQLKLTSVGFLRHILDTNLITLNLMLGIDFTMLDKSLKIMANEVDSLLKGHPVNTSTSRYTKDITELLGVKKADEVLTEISLYGKLKNIPDELNHTIFISDVNMKWNQETKSYSSVGQIGLGNIQGVQINRYIDGYLQITHKRSGDYLDLYLKLDKDKYYYFGYTRGVMQVLSHNKDFVNDIQDLSPKQRTMKTKRNETPYSYLISTDSKLHAFLNDFDRYNLRQSSSVVPNEPNDQNQPEEIDDSKQSPDQPEQ